MNPKPLVSIITPCYNGEKFAARFLDSVLAQTYPAIELFFVDDGSTDKTHDVVNGYLPAFEKRGYSLHYIYQENRGQAAAMNQALGRFMGEYLTWLDSDDFFLPTSIEERVAFLEQNPEYGFCVCQGKLVDEHDVDHVIKIVGRKPPKNGEKDNLFLDLIMERNVIFLGGGGVLRRAAFLSAIPACRIYPSREGQNWQMLLPMAYHFKCGYLEKPLFCVVDRKGSHSRRERSAEEQLERMLGFVDLLEHTIRDMGIPEEKEVLSLIRIKYAHRIIRLSAYESGHFCNKYARICQKQYLLLQESGAVSWKDFAFYTIYKSPVMQKAFVVLMEIWGRMKSFLKQFTRA